MTQRSLLDGMDLVDLSFPLSNRSPYWKSHCPVIIKPLKTPGSYPEPGNPFYLNMILLGEHSGTHVDAPCHNLALPRGDIQFGTIGVPPHTSVDQLPVGAFSGAAIVLEIESSTAARPVALGVKDIQDWESRHDRIPHGSLFLINTGYYRRWRELPDGGAYMDGEWSGFSAEAVGWLHDMRGVDVVGSDAPSIEAGAAPSGESAHALACSQGMRIIESLNYAELESRDLPRPWQFTLLCFPLRISRGSGSPVRAVAALSRS
jgi:arylformamidase